MTKSQYTKPTITRMGQVTEKTEGGFVWNQLEVMTKRL